MIILIIIVLIGLILVSRRLHGIFFDLPIHIKTVFSKKVENLGVFLQENKSHEINICSINGFSLASSRLPFPKGYLTIKDNSVIITWVSKNNNRQFEVNDFSFIKLTAKRGILPNIVKIGDKGRNCELIVSDDVFSLIQEKLN